MSTAITVSSTEMMHEGGTKFYEIVTFDNLTNGNSVEVRRWGKAEQLTRGGGQASVDSHPNLKAMAASSARQVKAKEKGGYRSIASKHVFHSNNGTHGEAQIGSGIAAHYSDSKTRDSILEKLGIDPTAPASPEPLKREEAPVDRGEQWGSW